MYQTGGSSTNVTTDVYITTYDSILSSKRKPRTNQEVLLKRIKALEERSSKDEVSSVCIETQQKQLANKTVQICDEEDDLVDIESGKSYSAKVVADNPELFKGKKFTQYGSVVDLGTPKQSKRSHSNK